VHQLVRHALLTVIAWTKTVGRDVAFPLLTTLTAEYAAQLDFANHARPDTHGLQGKVARYPVVRLLEPHVLQTQIVQTTTAGRDVVHHF
tara:strand:+ start:101 stop:367 length:267 start_codon:yes stop_codon:yes gene_type:complete